MYIINQDLPIFILHVFSAYFLLASRPYDDIVIFLFTTSHSLRIYLWPPLPGGIGGSFSVIYGWTTNHGHPAATVMQLGKPACPFLASTPHCYVYISIDTSTSPSSRFQLKKFSSVSLPAPDSECLRHLFETDWSLSILKLARCRADLGYVFMSCLGSVTLHVYSYFTGGIRLRVLILHRYRLYERPVPPD